MKWLRQQRKVDTLSAKASVRARQSRRFRLKIGQWGVHMAQQPGTLAWSFSTGLLVGAGTDKAKARRAQALLKWMNVSAMALRFLEKAILPQHQALEPEERITDRNGQ